MIPFEKQAGFWNTIRGLFGKSHKWPVFNQGDIEKFLRDRFAKSRGITGQVGKAVSKKGPDFSKMLTKRQAKALGKLKIEDLIARMRNARKGGIPARPSGLFKK